MIDLWLSSQKMTIVATVSDGRVVVTAPVARRFIGQPIDNLIRWMRKQGRFRMMEMGKGPVR